MNTTDLSTAALASLELRQRSLKVQDRARILREKSSELQSQITALNIDRIRERVYIKKNLPQNIHQDIQSSETRTDRE